MGFPATTADGQKINVEEKDWLGDRQLYIDDYGRSWIMEFDGLHLHDGNVAPVDPNAVEEAAAEAEPETEVTEVDEADIVDEDDIQPQAELVEVVTPDGTEDLVPPELLEGAVVDTSDQPFDFDLKPEDVVIETPKKASGRKPAAVEAVIPVEPDETPVADA